MIYLRRKGAKQIKRKQVSALSIKNNSTYFVETKNNTIFTPSQKTDMEIKFDKTYLQELYEIGKTTDKKHRLQPQTVSKYQKTVTVLKSVSRIEDLFRYNGLQYEALHGDKEGLESVRVNDQYRIEFKTTQSVSEPVATICNIIELSNHYK
jgi:proteic killer suppression protein